MHQIFREAEGRIRCCKKRPTGSNNPCVHLLSLLRTTFRGKCFILKQLSNPQQDGFLCSRPARPTSKSILSILPNSSPAFAKIPKIRPVFSVVWQLFRSFPKTIFASRFLETHFFNAKPSTPATCRKHENSSCFPPWEGTFSKV